MHELDVPTPRHRSTTTMPDSASPAWSRDQLDQLGVTTDLLTAAHMLGIGRTKAYQLARHGEFPTRVLRVGRTYRVAVAPLIELLGLDKEPSR